MKITYKSDPNDPPHPIMHGKTPIAKEFNKRQESLWNLGTIDEIDFSQITTVLLEIFADDYNKRHAPKKKKRTL